MIPTYDILWVASEENRLDYKDRQFYANNRGANLYIEFHFNAKEYDKPGMGDNPCSVIVADNASPKTKAIAAKLAYLASDNWDFPNRGCDVVGSDRAGYWNLYYTNMQAVLTELLYASDPEQAAIIRSEEGREELAWMHVDVIREFYPDGGLLAFSIGHMFKESSIHDRGAPVHGSDYEAEADYAKMLAERIGVILESGDTRHGPETEPEPAVSRVEGPLVLELPGGVTTHIPSGEFVVINREIKI